MSFTALIHRLNNRSLPLIPKLSKSTKTLLVLSSCFLFLVSSLYFSQRLLAAPNTNMQDYWVYEDSADSTQGNLTGWNGASTDDLFYHISRVVYGKKTITNVLVNKDRYGAATADGALGTINHLTASLYQPPISGIEYLASIKDNFLGKPALAQGVGFVGLQPILPLWRAFRNIVYILSSLVFISIGIMIILRVKISPQAVVTIQNAIPRIITSLILVTFSYAIAGLVIDGLQLIQSFTMAILFGAEGRSFGDNLFKGIFGTNIGAVNSNFNDLSTRGMGLVADLTARAAPLEYLLLIPLIIGTILLVVPGGQGAAVGVATVGSALILVIFGILMLVWMFKFYFGALKCYITAIFKIIIAPLEIGLGSFPTAKMGFSSWIWDLIANLAVFPITVIFLVIVNLIIDKTPGLWAPAIINTGLQGAFYNAITFGNAVAIGIGLTAIGIVSKLPELVPQVIFSLKPSPWTQAADETYKPYSQLVGNTTASIAGSSIATGTGRFGKPIYDYLKPFSTGNQLPDDAVPKQVGGIVTDILRPKR